jgi:hypothetical protein
MESTSETQTTVPLVNPIGSVLTGVERGKPDEVIAARSPAYGWMCRDGEVRMRRRSCASTRKT